MNHKRKDQKLAMKGLTLIGEIYRDVCPNCQEKVIGAYIRNCDAPQPSREVCKAFFEKSFGVTHRGL